MQFYIIHPDPKINVKLLPRYAIKKVNAREGHQILSDIGRIHEVYWKGQDRLYSKSHVLTRKFGMSKENFSFFWDHLYECGRVAGGTWFAKIDAIETKKAVFRITNLLEDWDEFQFTAHYLIHEKGQHITEEERKVLIGVLGGQYDLEKEA